MTLKFIYAFFFFLDEMECLNDQELPDNCDLMQHSEKGTDRAS